MLLSRVVSRSSQISKVRQLLSTNKKTYNRRNVHKGPQEEMDKFINKIPRGKGGSTVTSQDDAVVKDKNKMPNFAVTRRFLSQDSSSEWNWKRDQGMYKVIVYNESRFQAVLGSVSPHMINSYVIISCLISENKHVSFV